MLGRHVDPRVGKHLLATFADCLEHGDVVRALSVIEKWIAGSTLFGAETSSTGLFGQMSRQCRTPLGMRKVDPRHPATPDSFEIVWLWKNVVAGTALPIVDAQESLLEPRGLLTGLHIGAKITIAGR